VPDGLSQYCLEVHKVDLTTGGLAATGAKFLASGRNSLICTDGGTCDLDGAVNGVVFVKLGGGGQDELLEVRVWDESGNVRSVNVITVQTMIAVPPVVEPQTEIIPGLEDAALVSYRCPDVGHSVFDMGAIGIPGFFVPSTLEEMANFIYGVVVALPSWVNMAPANPFFRCGGNTAGNPVDDRVQWHTDKGLFTSVMGMIPAPVFTLGLDCPQGKDVSIFDGNVTWPAAPPGPPVTIENCDLDGAPNGTDTYMMLRQESGVATVTAQQGTLANSVRQTPVNWIGGVSAGLVPTINLFTPDMKSLPDLVSPLQQVEVLAVVLNQSLNPVAGMTVVCSMDPASSAFALLLDRGTTDAQGGAKFTLVPTAIPGTEVTVSCKIDGYPDIAAATHKFTFTLTPSLESVDLVQGCNPIAATWADGTAIATVAGAVAPAEALDAIWKFDPATATWQGFSPSAPAAVNDLTSVKRLDALFICVNAAATVARPVI
jgi:hypothetical protein